MAIMNRNRNRNRSSASTPRCTNSVLRMQTMLAFIIGFVFCSLLKGFYFYMTEFPGSSDDFVSSIYSDSNSNSVGNSFGNSVSNDNYSNLSDGGNGTTQSTKGTITEMTISEALKAKVKAKAINRNDDNTNNNDDNLDNNNDNDNFCSAAFGKHPKASTTIWSSHIGEIFKASQHVVDKEFIWHDFTAKLLNILTPERLLNSVKSLPQTQYQWQTVGQILQIAFKRWQFLESNEKNESNKSKNDNTKNNKENKPPRKVNILVMGGSVTMGVQCVENPVQDTSRFARRGCAWPSRLNQFLNSILGYHPNDVFRIDVITLGGTNTDTATTIWDYTLMPLDTPYPDIVIHAYATNDMHVLTSIEAQKQNITLDEMILKVNQKFIEKVLQPRFGTISDDTKNKSSSSCIKRPPFLMYYDDYIGNEQRIILETNAFSKAAHILSSYYGFSFISYADAVKDLVYSNTNEDWFSPHGWPERQIHPGMGMHIASSWVFAFNMLHLAFTYCSFNATATSSMSSIGFGNGHGHSYGSNNHEKRGKKPYIPINGLPELKNQNLELKGEPFEVPHNIPPELNEFLSIDNITDIWMGKQKEYNNNRSISDNNNINNNMTECEYNDHDEPMYRPCSFSWVGGLERRFDKSKHLTERMKPVLVRNDGWGASDENNKLGYIATKADASFEIEFKNINTPVRTLNFMVMKSYGVKWEGNQISVNAFVTKALDGIGHGTSSKSGGVGIQPTNSMDINGFHDKNTSETYTVQMDLRSNGSDGAGIGDNLNVQIRLIGGSTFKIMGMAFCDH